MPRHDIVIVKETHRGLLYEDGVLRDVLPAGRYAIPRPPSRLAAFLGAKGPRVEVALVDVRGRDRAVVVPDLLTAEGATISASFAVQYRVADPRAAAHRVKSFEERLVAEVQVAARRALRGMTLDEVMGSRDEIGEEMHRRVGESAAAYGLEVSALDFKDLVLPAEIREALNRAAFARRLGAAGLAQARDDDDFGPNSEGTFPLTGHPGADPEELEVVRARIAFEGDLGSRAGGALSDGLRRFRP